MVWSNGMMTPITISISATTWATRTGWTRGPADRPAGGPDGGGVEGGGVDGGGEPAGYREVTSSAAGGSEGGGVVGWWSFTSAL
ncbi:hypothetical protein GCM10027020_02580 [Nocardioides salsibiostraticola]